MGDLKNLCTCPMANNKICITCGDKMMKKLINYLVNKSNGKLDSEDIIRGLLGGFVWGFVVGLLGSIAGGIADGLVWGFVWGLLGVIAGGLVWGFVWGLGALISVNFIVYFQSPLLSVVSLTILTIILAELIFLYFDKSRPKKKDNKFWFTVKRKLLAFSESFIIIIQLGGLYNLGKKAILYLKLNFDIVLRWLGYIGLGIICIGIVVLILWGYIKLNEMKYNKR